MVRYAAFAKDMATSTKRKWIPKPIHTLMVNKEKNLMNESCQMDYLS